MARTNSHRIHAAVDDDVKGRIDVIEVFAEIDSTNSYLLRQVAPEHGRCRIAIADYQSAGRGQRGNVWVSPRLAGLYLSCAYTFAVAPRRFPCLTLAVGIAVTEALNEFGANCELKWPNDLVINNSKIGGILTEMRSAESMPTTVVTGIGLNLDFGEQLHCIPAGIGRVSDLRQSVAEIPGRIEIARLIVEHTVRALAGFDAGGFSAFHERWRKFDWLFDKPVRVAAAGDAFAGIACGIDDDGALLIRTGSATERVLSGTVTVAEDRGESR
jgi:BirA family transcriptional regulator, biotin operon repressor / biotin---[acetyl-CoA-carboxylase] ligase